ncbi:MAG TPA: toxin TcdB middle/N-terminal domain-containing protein [Xanthobacteraceae bacterium]
MEAAAKTGVDEGTTDLPSSGVQSLGDTFEPNLAMGGASYRIPIDLPAGPGGAVPKLDLLYATSAGNGSFGLGWALSLPWIERARSLPLAAAGEHFNVSGAERLVAAADGSYAPFIGDRLQRFRREGDFWTSRNPELLTMRFGASSESRISATVDGAERVVRWLLDRITFANGMQLDIAYDSDGSQRYVRELRWSVFRLAFVYAPRPDPFSQYDAGFELRTTRRCVRIELYHSRLPLGGLIRSYVLGYEQGAHTGVSLLQSLQISGWREQAGALKESRLPPLRLDYNDFLLERGSIKRMSSQGVPPPPIGDTATLFDLRGSALPGVLALDGDTGNYWENRGEGVFGPPQRLDAVPGGISLADPGVRFADLTGSGTADLVHNDTYYPNDPESGFLPPQKFSLAPTFDLADPNAVLLDLDGDRRSDLLSVRHGVPITFLNRGGRTWSAPFVQGAAAQFAGVDLASGRVRFADMNGDGIVDMVDLQSRRIRYWPYLGDGRWGEAREMEGSPAVDYDKPGTTVLVSDIDNDGSADLVLAASGTVSIFINRSGEGYAPPITLDRVPLLPAGRLGLADMRGTGSAALVWTTEGGREGQAYWYLELIGPETPHLLSRIDNGMGRVITIVYGSSTQQRIKDLGEGRRWSGYLPFCVPVVLSITHSDTVTGTSTTTEYSYHDGHFDRLSREYLGFAQVDSHRNATSYEAAVIQRMYFHNRSASATDPAFVAGRGQPRRTEVLDPTGAVRRVDEAEWDAVPVAGTATAYLALQKRKTGTRMQDGAAYESEDILYEHDSVGNVIRETRRGDWRDAVGTAHTDQLSIETRYAIQASGELTSYQCEIVKHDDGGRLLALERRYYDGPDFQGLDLGQVDRGLLSRVSEAVLTQREVDEAYGGAQPLLERFYRVETDPVRGKLWLRDTGRSKFDALGNTLVTLSPTGCRRTVTYDADNLLPVTVADDDGPARVFTFDPIAQQVARVADRNGNIFETSYDGLGAIVAVSRPGAVAGKPTETYEYRRDAVPTTRTRRIRVNADDDVPGAVTVEYLDGDSKVFQSRVLCGDGRWAVAKQKIMGDHNALLLERDAYFAASETFEPLPPAGTLERHCFYDFARRLVREETFGGHFTSYEYVAGEVRFFDPVAAAAHAGNPAVPPTRVNRHDAWARVVAIAEQDASGSYRQERIFDAVGRLKSLADPLGNTVLRTAYDLRGKRIRIESADCGVSVAVFDAGGNEVQRTDGDGRTIFYTRDSCGKLLEVRRDGPQGPVEETHSYGTDPAQQLVDRRARVEGAFGTVEYAYTPEGDPARIRRTFPGVARDYVVQFAYNTQRRVTAITYPDGTRIDYRYDATGKLAAIPGYVEAIDYGPTGLRERINYANGVQHSRKYSPGDLLLTELVTQSGDSGPTYQHLVFTLDAIGQVLAIDDQATVTGKVRYSQRFAYDARGRLTHAETQRGGGAAYDYRYDALGNLVFSGESFAEEMDYGHHVGDATHPNRLVKRRSQANPEYQYDGAGNLVADPAVGKLAYDARGRLVAIDRNDGARLEYVYDHNDRRIITRLVAGGTTTTRYEIEGIYDVEPATSTKIIVDEDRRLAVVPDAGDPLLHHFDRTGNVNVISNLRTGAFVGQNEYTPFGRLDIVITIQPAFTFQGGRFADGVDLVLLGARHYRPSLGRFVTGDRFLAENQEKIAGFIVGANLYVYAFDNPVNYTDPTGQIVFLLVLLIAVIIGAALGAVGAAMNGVKTWDEFLLWIVAGAIGGALTACGFYGIGLLLVGAGVLGTMTAAGFALTAIIVWGALGLVGALSTKALDDSDSSAAWGLSFALKLFHSPILTIIGLVVVLFMWMAGQKVDFRRGMLFVETGSGSDAVTLGAIAYTQSGWFNADGSVSDELAKHESVHSRTEAAVGELGFYVTYMLIGGIWGSIQAGSAGIGWFGLDARGCGNPLEKLAHTYNFPLKSQVSASSR